MKTVFSYAKRNLKAYTLKLRKCRFAVFENHFPEILRESSKIKVFKFELGICFLGI